MNLLRPKYLKYVVLGLISALVVTCWPRKEKPKGHPRDYAEIKESGILHAATEYNSISFYVDGDTVSGFHYELRGVCARQRFTGTGLSGDELQSTAGRAGQRNV